jgi:hypothetical protein
MAKPSLPRPKSRATSLAVRHSITRVDPPVVFWVVADDATSRRRSAQVTCRATHRATRSASMPGHPPHTRHLPRTLTRRVRGSVFRDRVRAQPAAGAHGGLVPPSAAPTTLSGRAIRLARSGLSLRPTVPTEIRDGWSVSRRQCWALATRRRPSRREDYRRAGSRW